MPSSVLEVMQNYKTYDASRQVLLALAAYSDKYGTRVFPSLVTLARDSGLSERHVQRCIAHLEAQHYLQVLRRKAPGKNARNYYVLLYPWRTTAQKSTDNTAQKSTDNTAQKSTDTRMSVEDLKKTKEREKRSGSADMPRNIPPEVLAYPNTPDQVQRYLTPGSEPYMAALSDYTPPPVPALRPAPWNTGPTIAHHFQLVFIIARFPDDPKEQYARVKALRRCLRQRHLEAAQAAEGKGCLLG